MAPLQWWSHEYKCLMHSHSQFISQHNRSDWVLFAEECAYLECRLGAAFVPELEGKFLATENFYHTSKVWSFLFGWSLLQNLYFKLNAGKTARLTFLARFSIFFHVNIFSHQWYKIRSDLWSLNSSLVCIQSPSFLIWWWLGRNFAMGIGWRSRRNTALSMRESCFCFVSRQHI